MIGFAWIFTKIWDICLSSLLSTDGSGICLSWPSFNNSSYRNYI